MIACIDTGSMDGIWAKRAKKIVHGLDIVTQGCRSCINICSMDDLYEGICTKTRFMDDLDERAASIPGVWMAGMSEPRFEDESGACHNVSCLKTNGYDEIE